jgi:hypothetical protein
VKDEHRAADSNFPVHEQWHSMFQEVVIQKSLPDRNSSISYWERDQLAMDNRYLLMDSSEQTYFYIHHQKTSCVHISFLHNQDDFRNTLIHGQELSK